MSRSRARMIMIVMMTVSQQNDQGKQQDVERANLDARFPVSPANSKIVKELLEPDTDAQLHKERAITVRNAAEFASRVPHEKCPKWTANTLETSCRYDVEDLQEMIEVAQKTAVTRHAQMAQTMSRSKVQNRSKSDLEQTAAQSPGAVMQTSSRQPRSRQVRCCRSRTDNRRA